MSKDTALVLLILLVSSVYVGIAIFVGWLAAKGFPRRRGRITYLLFSPIFFLACAGLTSWSQKARPVTDTGLPVKPIPFVISLFLVAAALGCFAAVFCY